jgi:nucleoid DNA-binding protein
MHKQEIIKTIAEKCNIRRSDIELVIDKFQETAIECLQNGDEFNLTGFLTIYYKDKKPRIQYNMKTGEQYMSGHRKLIEISKGSMLKALDKDVAQ